MTLQNFAQEHRLKISRDECGDQIIEGRRGHLYFDAGELCLMVTDSKPANRSSWAAVGGELWLGDISPNEKGQRVQDVKITGIPLENARLAIRMAQIKPKRIMTDAQKTAATVALKKAHSVLQGRTRLTQWQSAPAMTSAVLRSVHSIQTAVCAHICLANRYADG